MSSSAWTIGRSLRSIKALIMIIASSAKVIAPGPGAYNTIDVVNPEQSPPKYSYPFCSD